MTHLTLTGLAPLLSLLRRMAERVLPTWRPRQEAAGALVIMPSWSTGSGAPELLDHHGLLDHGGKGVVRCWDEVAETILPMPRAKLDKLPHEVAAMFDEVADRYDRTNGVLSFGRDRGWRLEVQRALDLRPGERLLDLAAGTGASSEPFADSGVLTVACDFSLGMLSVGRDRRPDLGFVAGDATRLPFAADAFDAVTISFGLRNVVDVPAALAEMRRVTRHGGRLLVCEFSHPTWAPFRLVYSNYLMRLLPVIARWTSSSPDSYAYLAESIRAWPDQRGLARQLADAGWGQVVFRNLTGGIVALHRATKC